MDGWRVKHQHQDSSVIPKNKVISTVIIRRNVIHSREVFTLFITDALKFGVKCEPEMSDLTIRDISVSANTTLNFGAILVLEAVE